MADEGNHMSELFASEDADGERSPRARDGSDLPLDDDAQLDGNTGTGAAVPTKPVPVYEFGAEPDHLDYVVHVRGLPWQVVPSDLLTFFEDAKVVRGGIVLTYNARGDGYVALESEADKELALKCHKKNLNRRYIEVAPATAEEFKSASENAAPGDAHFRTVVRMRGLPFEITKEELRAFFDGFALAPPKDVAAVAASLRAAGRNPVFAADLEAQPVDYVPPHAGALGSGKDATLTQNVYIGVKPEGRANGDAYVLFESEAEATRAADSCNNKDIKGRAAALSVTTQGEVYSHITLAVKQGLASDADYDGVVKVRGLPYTTTVDDIWNLLEGSEECAAFEAVEGGVFPVRRRDGRFGGEAYIILSSDSEAKRAVAALNGRAVGDRSIEVVQVLKGELYSAAGGALQLEVDSAVRNVVLLRGIPFASTPDSIAQFLEASHVETKDIFIIQLPTGRPSGDCYVLCADEATAVAIAASADKQTLGGRTVDATPVRRIEYYNAVSRVPLHAGSNSARGVEKDALDTFLKVRGLPFEATEKEVEDFFEGFNPKKVLIQLSNGKPTGEAFVDFGSVKAARAAMARNKATMAPGGRYLELFPASRKDTRAPAQPASGPRGGPRRDDRGGGGMGGGGGRYGGGGGRDGGRPDFAPRYGGGGGMGGGDRDGYRGGGGRSSDYGDQRAGGSYRRPAYDAYSAGGRTGGGGGGGGGGYGEPRYGDRGGVEAYAPIPAAPVDAYGYPVAARVDPYDRSREAYGRVDDRRRSRSRSRERYAAPAPVDARGGYGGVRRERSPEREAPRYDTGYGAYAPREAAAAPVGGGYRAPAPAYGGGGGYGYEAAPAPAPAYGGGGGYDYPAYGYSEPPRASPPYADAPRVASGYGDAPRAASGYGEAPRVASGYGDAPRAAPAYGEAPVGRGNGGGYYSQAPVPAYNRESYNRR